MTAEERAALIDRLAPLIIEERRKAPACRLPSAAGAPGQAGFYGACAAPAWPKQPMPPGSTPGRATKEWGLNQ